MLSRSNVISAGLALLVCSGLAGLFSGSACADSHGGAVVSRRQKVPVVSEGFWSRKIQLLPPLRKGMVWTYRGTVEVAGCSKQKIVWRQEVLQVLRYKNTIAALLKGNPRDLWNYDNGFKPGRYLWVCVNNKQLYLIEGDQVETVLKLFRSGKDPAGELHSYELTIDAPLRMNKMYGADEPSQAPMFCWAVDGRSAANLKGIKLPENLRKAAHGADCYSIIYRANTDHTIVGFVPGLGFTGYSGSHHGTLHEIDLDLVELSYAP